MVKVPTPAPVGRDTRDAGWSRRRSRCDGGYAFRPRMAWTRIRPLGERSQRIGAWWKPEEPEPCWICPPSHRLNGWMGSRIGARGSGIDSLGAANPEPRTSPVGRVGSPPIPGEGWACISGAPYPPRLWSRGHSEQGGTVSVSVNRSPRGVRIGVFVFSGGIPWFGGVRCTVSR